MSSGASSSSVLKREAIAWHARLSAPDATAEDWAAFTDWLEANPLGNDLYDEIEFLSRNLGRSHAILDAADDVSLPPPAQPAENITVLRPRRTRAPSGWTWLAAAAAVAIAFVAVPNLRDADGPDPQYAWKTYTAPAGQREEIKLADGSTVTLNSGSSISVALMATERRVKLSDSEAFFSVTHDADRPFIVDSGQSQVRVLGTQFNVVSKSGRLEVGVQEGRVEVSLTDKDDTKFVLTSGKELVRAGVGAQAEVRDIDIATAFAWRQGSLIYDDVPLTEIILDVNRNFARPVVLASDVDGTMRFSGVLALGSEEDVVDALVAFLSLEAEASDQQITLHARR
ncbi:MAG: DUF4880 domain-containing protein [Hyphomonas sp.]|uniref:FecR family protein n=1 Tax=Hyphomonas sp. TaxID=87 RepID=UPI00180EDBA2|nr:FecR domain-containing protein [Hyphomonas sp.]MBA3069386.1 DUF4880 domain-containing protein [Hyphomonas sp.]MBU3920395.1 FecR domain-containing protein [Alphaproteobacteria bacterium]MBU4063768.1 FecR domain-containing protein [Alphaproteobacteria bacterium]MBU4164271.1 FecR domain-containing protein [Alphaproteobacteria bacterium]